MMKTLGTVAVSILLLIALWLFSLRGKRKEPGFFGLSAYCYAHRGLHGSHAPENSVAAFRRAAEAGYGAELDVHLSRDGELIVMHDESLKRTAGVDKNICDCTAAELKQLCLEGTEEKIPLLREVLPIFAGKTPLVIELKPFHRNHAALAEKTCALLKEFPSLQFCIESFDPRALYWLRRHQPQIVRGQLSCNFLKDHSGLAALTSLLLTDLTTNFLTVPHFVAYRFSDRKRLSLRLCRKLWGVQEFSWTVRSQQDAKTAMEDGSIIIFEHCRPSQKGV